MRTTTKPRLATLDEAALREFCLAKVRSGLQQIEALFNGLADLERTQAAYSAFEQNFGTIFKWVVEGIDIGPPEATTMMHALLDVLYGGTPPSVGLYDVQQGQLRAGQYKAREDSSTPLALLLAAGLGREHLEKGEPIPVAQLAALAGTDRTTVTKFIRAGRLRRTARPKRGRAVDAPVLASDASRWLKELGVPGFE